MSIAASDPTASGPSTPLTVADLAAFAREVQRFLRVCGCDAATAADLWQEVLLRATERRLVFPVAAAARAWLRRSARLLLLEEGRRRRRSVPVLDPEWLDAVEVHFAKLPGDGPWTEAVRACVARLRGRAASAIALAYGERRPHASIAAQLGLGPEGLKTLLRRTRERLRACILGRLGGAVPRAQGGRP